MGSLQGGHSLPLCLVRVGTSQTGRRDHDDRGNCGIERPQTSNRRVRRQPLPLRQSNVEMMNPYCSQTIVEQPKFLSRRLICVWMPVRSLPAPITGLISGRVQNPESGGGILPIVKFDRAMIGPPGWGLPPCGVVPDLRLVPSEPRQEEAASPCVRTPRQNCEHIVTASNY